MVAESPAATVGEVVDVQSVVLSLALGLLGVGVSVYFGRYSVRQVAERRSIRRFLRTRQMMSRSGLEIGRSTSLVSRSTNPCAIIAAPPASACVPLVVPGLCGRSDLAMDPAATSGVERGPRVPPLGSLIAESDTPARMIRLDVRADVSLTAILTGGRWAVALSHPQRHRMLRAGTKGSHGADWNPA